MGFIGLVLVFFSEGLSLFLGSTHLCILFPFPLAFKYSRIFCVCPLFLVFFAVTKLSPDVNKLSPNDPKNKNNTSLPGGGFGVDFGGGVAFGGVAEKSKKKKKKPRAKSNNREKRQPASGHRHTFFRSLLLHVAFSDGWWVVGGGVASCQ